jgi:hypothetical protein
MKIKKQCMYRVIFTHYLNKEDTIEDLILGKDFFKMRNWLGDLGYSVTNIEEVD